MALLGRNYHRSDSPVKCLFYLDNDLFAGQVLRLSNPSHIDMCARTSDSAVDIYKPYVTLKFSTQSSSDDTEDGPCPHPYPSILALGILLLEIELGRTITSARTAEDGQHNHSPLDTGRRTASRILQSVDFRKSVYRGYRAAIEACLDCKFIPHGTFTSDVDCRGVIYNKVVASIEKELYDGRGILVNDPQNMAGDLQTMVAIPSASLLQSVLVSSTFSSSGFSGDIKQAEPRLYRPRHKLEQLSTTIPTRTAPCTVSAPDECLFDDDDLTDAEKQISDHRTNY